MSDEANLAGCQRTGQVQKTKAKKMKEVSNVKIVYGKKGIMIAGKFAFFIEECPSPALCEMDSAARYQAILINLDGWIRQGPCGHRHRSRTSAVKCGQKLLRKVAVRQSQEAKRVFGLNSTQPPSNAG
jgi:hypothetical protein